MAKADRSVSVCLYGDEWHLVCYDSGYPVGGSIFLSYPLQQPIIGLDGKAIGRDYGDCCAHLEGQRFIETGLVP